MRHKFNDDLREWHIKTRTMFPYGEAKLLADAIQVICDSKGIPIFDSHEIRMHTSLMPGRNTTKTLLKMVKRRCLYSDIRDRGRPKMYRLLIPGNSICFDSHLLELETI